MFERMHRQVQPDQLPASRVAPRRPRTVQAKLAVGAVDDPAEREADQIADHVVAMLSGAGREPRQPTSMAPPTSRIRRASTSAPVVGVDGGTLDATTESRIRASSGRPLDPASNEQMASAFGTDLSAVRIHTGTRAAQLSRSLNARAFTLGSDIYFGRDEYRPETPGGQRLLAHEIAHTVQQQPDDARRTPTVRRFIRLRKDPVIAPETPITTTAALKPALTRAGITLQQGPDNDAVKVIMGWMNLQREVVFDTVSELLDNARSYALERPKAKADIDPFAMKAEESRSDDPSAVRSESPSSHYDFRNNPDAKLPHTGPDPTEPKKKARKGAEEEPEYYYHVSSYTNLRGIFDNGLNPTAGGGVGGSSFQNADAKMNEASANDSRNKVFVATVGKLTQRYLSLRLRQSDLFKRHGACIVDVLADKTGLSQEAAELVFSQICLGEEAVVLRFKNIWRNVDWEHDPIDKAAFALKGQAVPAANIECLSLGGWANLTVLTEIANIIPTDAQFTNFRGALLAFYGKHNETLENTSEPAGWGVIPDLLLAVLSEKKLVV